MCTMHDASYSYNLLQALWIVAAARNRDHKLNQILNYVTPFDLLF